jgi:LuxR family maltose regulon positive regulatory protein
MRDLLVDHLNSGTAHWPLLLELIEAAEHEPPPQRDPSGFPSQPLTDRELTVLRYLQSMLSNVEIAGELFLSVNTVKTHVRNIYRKFDVATRRDAVRRARELRLL